MKLLTPKLSVIFLTCMMLFCCITAQAQITDLTDEQLKILNDKSPDAHDIVGVNPWLEALVENARSWKPAQDEEALSFGKNTLDNLMNKADRYKGQLFKLDAKILTINTDTPLSDGSSISTLLLTYQASDGKPKLILLYLTNPDKNTLLNGSKVSLYARYLQPMDPNFGQSPIPNSTQQEFLPAFVGHSFQNHQSPAQRTTPLRNTPRRPASTQASGTALETYNLNAIHAAGVTPLTESQRLRMENAHEGHVSLENSAFYSLSENARTWTNQQAVGFSPIPYQDLLDDPAKYRGMPFLIKGRLLKSWEVHVSRQPDQFKKMRQWQIAIEWPGHPQGRIINVFLTDPPEVDMRGVALKNGNTTVRDDEGNAIIEHYEARDSNGIPVELVARFYKNQNLETRKVDEVGAPVFMDYPCFIGHSATVIPEAEEGLGAGKYIIGLVVIMMIAFAFAYFWNKKNKESGRQNGLREEISRRRKERLEDGEDDEQEYEDPDNLPEDPLKAMEILNQHHPEKVDPIQALAKLEEIKASADLETTQVEIKAQEDKTTSS